MKKKLLLFVLFVICIFCSSLKVNALEVSELNPEVVRGQTKDIELYVNTETDINRIEFSLVYLSDEVIGTFESELGIWKKDGLVNSISFDTPIKGRVKLGIIKINVLGNSSIDIGGVNLYNATATSVNGVKTNLNAQNIKVNVVNESVNLLKEIKSDIVDIKLEEDKYEYEVRVDNNVDKLDLIAVPIDNTYNVEISDQSIKQEKNQIIIRINKENMSEEYIINVIKEEKEDVNIIKESSRENLDYKTDWIIVMVVLGCVFIIGLVLLIKSK